MIKKPIIILFIISLSFNIFAQDNYAFTVTEEFKDIELKEALSQLSNNYKLKFAYDDKLINGVKVNGDYKNKKISPLLNDLLSGTCIDFQITENAVLLYLEPHKKSIEPKEEKPLTYTIGGIVKDKKTNAALPYASVILQDNKIGTNTNISGYFDIHRLTPDSIEITVTYLGYKLRKIKVLPGTDKYIEIFLEISEQNLAEISIKREAIEMLEFKAPANEGTKINPKLISVVPNSGETDPFRTIQLLPGITAAGETSSGLKVHGGTSDQSLILFDDFKVFHIDHFYGIFSAFNTNSIETIDIHKTGYASKYGGRVSGVVDIVGKSADFKKFSGNVNLNLISLSGTLEIPLNKTKGSLFISARRSYTDYFQTHLYESLVKNLKSKTYNVNTGSSLKYFDNNKNDTKFYFYDINSKLTFKPNKKNLISFTFYKGIDNFNYEYNDELNEIDIEVSERNGENTKWDNTGLSAKWNYIFGAKFQTYLNVAYSKYVNSYNNIFNTEYLDDENNEEYSYSTSQKNSISDLSVKYSSEYLFNPKNKLNFGIEFGNRNSKYRYAKSEDGFSDIRNEATNLSAFLQSKNFLFKEKLSIVSGVRGNYDNLTHRFYFDPRISVEYRISNNFSFNIATGIYHQFIQKVVLDDVINGNQDFWLLAGTENIPVLKSNHYIAGLKYSRKKFAVGIDIYTKNIIGLTGYDLDYLNSNIADNQGQEGVVSDATESNNSLKDLYYNEKANITGFDVMFHKKSGIWNGWLCYSLVKMDRNFDFIDENNNIETYNQEVKLVNILRFKKWDFSQTWIFSSGKPYTEPVDAYKISLSNGEDVRIIEAGEKDARKLMNYHRLDISACRNFRIKKCNLKLGISIINLYNRKNIKMQQFSLSHLDNENEQISDKLEISANAVKLMSITPNIFLSLQF